MNTELFSFLAGLVVVFFGGVGTAWFWFGQALKKDFSYPVMNWICGAQGIGAEVTIEGLVFRIKLPDQEVCEMSLEPYLREMVQETYRTDGKIHAIKLARQALHDLKKSKEYVESVCER